MSYSKMPLEEAIKAFAQTVRFCSPENIEEAVMDFAAEILLRDRRLRPKPKGMK